MRVGVYELQIARPLSLQTQTSHLATEVSPLPACHVLTYVGLGGMERERRVYTLPWYRTYGLTSCCKPSVYLVW